MIHLMYHSYFSKRNFKQTVIYATSTLQYIATALAYNMYILKILNLLLLLIEIGNVITIILMLRDSENSWNSV